MIHPVTSAQLHDLIKAYMPSHGAGAQGMEVDDEAAMLEKLESGQSDMVDELMSEYPELPRGLLIQAVSHIDSPDHGM